MERNARPRNRNLDEDDADSTDGGAAREAIECPRCGGEEDRDHVADIGSWEGICAVCCGEACSLCGFLDDACACPLANHRPKSTMRISMYMTFRHGGGGRAHYMYKPGASNERARKPATWESEREQLVPLSDEGVDIGSVSHVRHDGEQQVVRNGVRQAF